MRMGNKMKLSEVKVYLEAFCATNSVTVEIIQARFGHRKFVILRKRFAKEMSNKGYTLKVIADAMHRDHTTIGYYVNGKGTENG